MAPLTLEGALVKLRDTSIAIQRRNGVKDAEAKRIRDAILLLRNGPPPSDVRGSKRQTKYLEFLRKVLEVNKANGHSMVVLCAVALGVSLIAIARDNVQLNLPFMLKDDHRRLSNSCLQRLAKQYFDIYDSPSVERSHGQIETTQAGHRVTSAETTSCQNQIPFPPSERLPAVQTSRQIDYKCSTAPITQMHHLGDLLFDAVKSSRQWQWEREVGAETKATTDCLIVLVPENRNQDISITLRVGHEKGLGLIEKFQLASM